MRLDAANVPLVVPGVALLAVGAAVLVAADGWAAETIGGAVCVAGGVFIAAWRDRRSRVEGGDPA